MKNFPGEPAPPVRARALDEVPERVRQIAMLRGLGYSYRQIASPLQVTPQAVSLMLTRHRRSLKSLRDAMELNSLSARAVNVLGRHGTSAPASKPAKPTCSSCSPASAIAGERRWTKSPVGWGMTVGIPPVPMVKAPQGTICTMFDRTEKL